MMSMTNKRKKGFTLVELMVVLVIHWNYSGNCSTIIYKLLEKKQSFAKMKKMQRQFIWQQSPD